MSRRGHCKGGIDERRGNGTAFSALAPDERPEVAAHDPCPLNHPASGFVPWSGGDRRKVEHRQPLNGGACDVLRMTARVAVEAHALLAENAIAKAVARPGE